MKNYVVFVILLPTILFSQEYWNPTNGPYGAYLRTLFIDSTGKLWAGTDGGFYTSTNQGSTWKFQISYFTPTNFIITTKGKIIATHYWGGYDVSIDQGKTWQYGDFPAGFFDVRYLFIDRYDRMFAGTDQGLYRSTDDGVTWTLSSQFGGYAVGQDIEGRMYAPIATTICYSTDFGDTWMAADSIYMPTDNRYISNFAFNSSGDVFGATQGGVLRSSDKGITWRLSKLDSEYIFIEKIAIDKKDNIYCATNKGLYNSTNNGISWQKIGCGFKNLSSEEILIDSSGIIYAGINSSLIIRSTDNGLLWDVVVDSLDNISITSIDINKYDEILVGTNFGNIYYSSDKGKYWKPTFSLPTIAQINTINWGDNNEIFVGTYDDGLYYSADSGHSWMRRNEGLDIKDYERITSFIIDKDNKIFLGSFTGVYLSTNSGENWKRILQTEITCLKKNSQSTLFAGALGVFRSSDIGNSWQKINNKFEVATLNIDPSDNLFVGTYYSGLYRSTNNGSTWEEIEKEIIGSSGEGIPLRTIGVNSQGSVFASVPRKGFLKSTDNGITWKGLNTFCGSNLAFDSEGYMYTTTKCVYISGISTTTSVIHNTLLDKYFLSQNFPNPFNPSTTILFDIPVGGVVSLNVYNILGQNVATLVNEYKQGGHYEIIFEDNSLSSGIYFYKLIAGKFSATKKLLLLK